MSARRKLRGHAAVWCDVEGCGAVRAANWWGANAEGARIEASGYGWTRCLVFTEKGNHLVDVCPAHTHIIDCSCPRPNSVLLNPDCRAGKHDVCDGGGWDHVADEEAACPCPCHES